ncbi:MAG: hypothetical protein ABIW31_08290 [Novosphingobium sp.]
MSKNLALSSALSVLMMAGFALFGQHSATAGGEGSVLISVPAKAELPAPAAFPSFPGLR